ncbi:hypothetical protein Csa_018418 [Cucumis sativus]|uniref:Secreted protein n=1 Tax=Cucumis sativus TaxID=3659 RepID=A0A0A0KJB0_CUCSA|nr:hypothetical protein Csa_018418 [Cucumis sativus]
MKRAKLFTFFFLQRTLAVAASNCLRSPSSDAPFKTFFIASSRPAKCRCRPSFSAKFKRKVILLRVVCPELEQIETEDRSRYSDDISTSVHYLLQATVASQTPRLSHTRQLPFTRADL